MNTRTYTLYILDAYRQSHIYQHLKQKKKKKPVAKWKLGTKVLDEAADIHYIGAAAAARRHRRLI